MRRYVVLLGLLFLPVPLLATQYSPPELDGSPVEVVKRLYSDLLEFKDTTTFREMGFAVASPYNKWLKTVESIKGKKEFTEALLPLGVVPGELEMLGLEYVGSKGKETTYTKFIREQFDKAFKVSHPK